MRLAVRTGLAAFVAASVTLLLVGLLFRGQLGNELQARVDRQLERRAETAPVLAAIADRLSTSELSATLEGARVERDGRLIELGVLPADPLPDVLTPGWSTVTADGERWRLHTIDVVDVPAPGDHARVQMVAPLGDADAAASRLRHRAALVGLLTSVVAGLVGAGLGALAARPLSALRRDAARLDGADPRSWSVADRYGSPEVDDVAATLNANLEQLARETVRRGQALESARAFVSTASHELRTPLQSALTNLDIAGSPASAPDDRLRGVGLAHEQLLRMASSLTALRALADAEFADPSSFAAADLADLVDVAVAGERRRHADVDIEVVAGDEAPVDVWADGVQLAVANIVRNAVVHGRRGNAAPRVRVTVAGRAVTVDDDGPGIDEADRQRVLQRFERGAGSTGDGLGLTIAHQVAIVHGGHLTVDRGPLGGARVTISFVEHGDRARRAPEER